MSQSFIKKPDNGPHSALGALGVPSARTIKFTQQDGGEPVKAVMLARREKPWPMEEQPDGTVTPVDPGDMALPPCSYCGGLHGDLEECRLPLTGGTDKVDKEQERNVDAAFEAWAREFGLPMEKDGIVGDYIDNETWGAHQSWLKAWLAASEEKRELVRVCENLLHACHIADVTGTDIDEARALLSKHQGDKP